MLNEEQLYSLEVFFTSLYEETEDVTYVPVSDIVIAIEACDITNPILIYEWLKDKGYGHTMVNDDGVKYYYYNGKAHRMDGPACEPPEHSKQKAEYWVCGQELSKDEFNNLT